MSDVVCWIYFEKVPLGDESATWKLQGGRSGHGTLFDDIKLRVWPQEKVLILKRNSYLNPNERFVYF